MFPSESQTKQLATCYLDRLANDRQSKTTTDQVIRSLNLSRISPVRSCQSH